MKSSEYVDEILFSLERYCHSITDSAWDAEDLIQDTCLRALPVLSGIKEHPNAIAYLLRTAKNLSIDKARRRRLARKTMEERSGELEAIGLADGRSPEETEHALSLLVTLLSPRQLFVFLLRDVFGYSGAGTAQALHMTEGAVKAALHRAREAVRPLKGAEAAEQETAIDEGQRDLLTACLHAVRHWNPQAVVALAMIGNGQADAAQASALTLSQGRRADRTGSTGSISMMLAAAA